MASYEVTLNEIVCEKFKEVRGFKQCVLTERTVISSPEFSLALLRDESVDAIALAYNKNIQYLPLSAHEVLPNLRWIDAAVCAIKSISHANFASLVKLEKLHLDANFIEEIEARTFDGLVALKEIYLSEYQKLFKFILFLSFIFRLQPNQVHRG